MRNILFKIAGLRRNYWFWPSAMTVFAVVLGFLLPWVDSEICNEWMQSFSFIRPTQVDGARAILTTLAAATLGVAGVAFSVTIVAVSFASSNYGPRLIGNFMGDRTNQIVLGIFVATFVYCITVLTTVHARLEMAETTQQAFVPQGSVFFALFLTLTAVGALIIYIHHIPESINIMNVTAGLGAMLQTALVAMLEDEDKRRHKSGIPTDLEPWCEVPPEHAVSPLRAEQAGFLQQVDLMSLTDLALARDMQITLHRAPGEFLVKGQIILSADKKGVSDEEMGKHLRKCVTLGSNRTDIQDILFLSDQLVEVLGRALSPGINDPNTAMLCLNWLSAGLMTFADRAPVLPPQRTDAVLYRRLKFEDMLNQSFDQMRQYIGTDRTVTLHAIRILGDLAQALVRDERRAACYQQIERLAASATELQSETAAKKEISDACAVAMEGASISGS